MTVNRVPLAAVAAINPREPALPEDANFVPMDGVSSESSDIKYFEKRGSRSGARARGGDLLYARITPCLQNGKIAIVPKSVDRCGGSTELLVVRPQAGLLTRFLYHLMASQEFRHVAVSMMEGATGRQRLSAENLGQIEIPLPSIQEQERLILLLDEASLRTGEFHDLQVSAAQATNELVTSALTNRIKGLECEEVPLDSVCIVEYGERVVRRRDGGSNYPVYGGGDVTFRIDRFNRENRVVVSRFGMSQQCVRRVHGKFFLNDSGLTVATKSEELSQDFLDLQLLSRPLDIYDLGRGTAQKNLSVKAFRELPLKLPTLPEQEDAVVKATQLLETVPSLQALSERRLELIGELYSSILNQVGEGGL